MKKLEVYWSIRLPEKIKASSRKEATAIYIKKKNKLMKGN